MDDAFLLRPGLTQALFLEANQPWLFAKVIRPIFQELSQLRTVRVANIALTVNPSFFIPQERLFSNSQCTVGSLLRAARTLSLIHI